VDFYAVAHLVIGLIVGLALIYLACAVDRLADAVTTRETDREEW